MGFQILLYCNVLINTLLVARLGEVMAKQWWITRIWESLVQLSYSNNLDQQIKVRMTFQIL